MVKHIAMFKIKDYAFGLNKQQIIEKLKNIFLSLRTEIKGIINLEVGENYFDHERAFDIVLYCEFNDKEALDNYRVHPSLLKHTEFIHGVRTESGIVDYEI